MHLLLLEVVQDGLVARHALKSGAQGWRRPGDIEFVHVENHSAGSAPKSHGRHLSCTITTQQ